MRNYNEMFEPTAFVVAEYIKWLSYESQLEMDRIKLLHLKRINSLSISELDEIRNYKIRRIFLDLLLKFQKGKCSTEEKAQINDYIFDMPLEEVMLSKLTASDLQIVKEKITEVLNISKSELDNKIKFEQKLENYNNLSMIDACVLHTILEYSLNKDIEELKVEMDSRVIKNERKRQKSLKLFVQVDNL